MSNGCIIPHTPIAVDTWSPSNIKHSKLFFLSHCHTDHTVGLTSSWKTHKIYCSKVSAQILFQKYKVREDLVVVLPVGQTSIILMDEYGKEKLYVTLIDANHCPGGVMFLFQGYFGTVLYTGDFRFDPSMVETNSLLNSITIDTLYLDNTYCSSDSYHPSRQEAKASVIDFVRRCLESGYHILLILKSFGKEQLLVEIAHTMQTWIGVDPSRYNLYQAMNLPNVFTTDVNCTKLQVVNQRYEVLLETIKRAKERHPTVAIITSAMVDRDKKLFASCPDVYVIPYSDHSSYHDLITFVSWLKPKKIVPIVDSNKAFKNNADLKSINMDVFNRYLNNEPLRLFTIPLSVFYFMNGSKAFNTTSLKPRHQTNTKHIPSAVVYDNDKSLPQTSARQDTEYSKPRHQTNTKQVPSAIVSGNNKSLPQTSARQDIEYSKPRHQTNTKQVPSAIVSGNNKSLPQTSAMQDTEYSKVAATSKFTRAHFMNTNNSGLSVGQKQTNGDPTHISEINSSSELIHPSLKIKKNNSQSSETERIADSEFPDASSSKIVVCAEVHPEPPKNDSKTKKREIRKSREPIEHLTMIRDDQAALTKHQHEVIVISDDKDEKRKSPEKTRVNWFNNPMESTKMQTKQGNDETFSQDLMRYLQNKRRKATVNKRVRNINQNTSSEEPERHLQNKRRKPTANKNAGKITQSSTSTEQPQGNRVSNMVSDKIKNNDGSKEFWDLFDKMSTKSKSKCKDQKTNKKKQSKRLVPIKTRKRNP